MYESEILARVVATGGSVTYTEHTIECSSANAPWRDLIRFERSSKELHGVDLSCLWATIGIAQSSGVLDQRIDGGALETTTLKAGNVFVYPQGASIYARTTQPVRCTCIQIAPSVMNAVADELRRSPRVMSYRAARDKQIERMAALLEAEIELRCAAGRLYGEYLAYAFAAHVVHRYGKAAESASASVGRLRNGKLAAALEYIQAHATQELSLHELADAVHLSPFHFSRIFKQSTGLAPHQYVLQWRIEEAKRLMRHSRLELAEISNRLGFRDQSHFTASFRKVTGATPRRWREGV